jgi:hypothetical protein
VYVRRGPGNHLAVSVLSERKGPSALPRAR